MLENKTYPQILLRYGLARKKDLLKDFGAYYDGLIIPANILLYQYRSTPGFIYSCQKPYVIDPMSYLFSIPFNTFKKRMERGYEFKPSFSKLALGHGQDPEVLVKMKYSTFLHSLKNDRKKLDGFIKSCMDMQINRVQSVLEESSEFIDDNTFNLKPEVIIPPYLSYSSENTNDINKIILEYVEHHYSDYSVFPLILIDKNNLRLDYIKFVASFFKGKKFKGYFIWLDDFDERYANDNDIRCIVDLVKTLKTNDDIQIISLFGGFLTMLLYSIGLTAISHGIAYSESKSILAAAKQKGGGSFVRYYIPRLHQFLTIENSIRVLKEKPELICECPICNRIIKGDPNNIAKFEKEEELAELHFLYNRSSERKFIGEKTLNELAVYLLDLKQLTLSIEKVTKLYATYKGPIERSIIESDYLKNWHEIINELSKT